MVRHHGKTPNLYPVTRRVSITLPGHYATGKRLLLGVVHILPISDSMATFRPKPPAAKSSTPAARSMDLGLLFAGSGTLFV